MTVNSRRGFLTVREALILLGGLMAGIAAGILTYFAAHNLAQAVLVGVPACVGAVKLLDVLIA